MHHVEPSSRKK